jgi:hypothetical protein
MPTETNFTSKKQGQSGKKELKHPRSSFACSEMSRVKPHPEQNRLGNLILLVSQSGY